jgi:hypothetical protein
MIMKIDRRFANWWRRNTDPSEKIGLSHWVAYRKESTMDECKFESH